MVVAISALFLLAFVLLNVPSVQDRISCYVSRELSERLQARISVERVKVGLWNRLIADGLQLYDQNDTLMLQVSRVAAKLELIPLLEHKIHINNAQLFGAKAVIYQPEENAPYNFQFVIDALSSKDNKDKHPIDLQVGSLLVRRCDIKYDCVQQKRVTGKIDFNHLAFTNINATAQLRKLTPDSINVKIKRFDFQEKSGLKLNRLSMDLKAGNSSFDLSNFLLVLPHSEIDIPDLEATYAGLPEKEHWKEWIKDVKHNGLARVKFTPSDIGSCLPDLKNFNDSIRLYTEWKGSLGNIAIKQLNLSDWGNNISLTAEATASDVGGNTLVNTNILSLNTSRELQEFITRNLKGSEREISPFLTRIGSTQTKGNVSWGKSKTTADITVSTQLGTVEIDGEAKNWNQIEAKVNTNEFDINNLLGNNEKLGLDKVSLETSIKGKIKDEDGYPNLTAEGILNEICLKNYHYHGIAFTGNCHSKAYMVKADIPDKNGSVQLESRVDLGDGNKNISLEADLKEFTPYELNLTKKFKGEHFSSHLTADISGTNLDKLNGNISIDSLIIHNDTIDTLYPGNILITSENEGDEQHVTVDSPILSLRADGNFRWSCIGKTFTQIISSYIPGIFSTSTTDRPYQDEVDFTARIQDTTYIKRLAGIQLNIPQSSVIQGQIDGSQRFLNINAQIPSMTYGSEHLQNVQWRIESSHQYLQTSMVMDRLMKGKPVEMGVDAYTRNNQIMANMHWDNHRQPSQKGEISLTGELTKDETGNQYIKGRISPSDVIVSDTVWKFHAANIRWKDHIMSLDTLRIAQGDRYMNIAGNISKQDDTLTVNIHKMKLSYIFNIINFHTVDFDGEATGCIYGKRLLSGPAVDAFLNVHDFTFNGGEMGNMDLHGNLGDRGKSIWLDANINDIPEKHHTTVQGTITPGRGPGTGLDLNIHTRRINLYFLNKFTKSIFTDFQGRATGTCHIFGPFKQINVEGDMFVNNANMHINALGTDYHLQEDSVILRPDNIWIRNATVYDKLGNPDVTDHKATVNCHLMHQNMKRMRYDVNIQANNILGYDFKDYEDMPFFATIFASGNVHLNGEPGSINIDIDATPMEGSQLTYNSTNPETLTEAKFMTYITPKDTILPNVEEQKKKEEESKSDIHMNFNINMTRAATLNVMMDTKTEDCISLCGDGRITANYYNKGKFRMYGTYLINNGLYKMSIQDVIRKDFVFMPGGTIVFGGNALQAALNLKAKYTVPNVSLDDLSATGLGLSNTRVDCIMNLTGKAGAPAVTFDFDLPNANEDEKQMVRSMLSTEEERNMQVIYLLGIGRFYSYGTQYMTGNSQSTTAMNSLLSSTLSNQFNQMMSNVVGSNWSFGANLRTGETGWSELDVEGLLSGRLLNNRLLLNGNFGYRESYYSTNNFIGDFDVQYLLTPNGGIALKAYNQTNDRYFIQSSLTTQGIGIQFKKDFNRWKEFIQSNKKKKRKK